MNRRTFRDILNEAQPACLRRVRDRALHANALAKTLSGANRRKMYRVKHSSGSRAIELDAAIFSEVILRGNHLYCGIAFPDSIGGGRIHLPLDERISVGAKTRLLLQANSVIGSRWTRQLEEGEALLVSALMSAAA